MTKLTNELLKAYNVCNVTTEMKFEYANGTVCKDNVEIAEFDKVEIQIKPSSEKMRVSIMNSGSYEKTTGYTIKVNLSITKSYNRYNKVDKADDLDICVKDGLIVKNCNFSHKDKNNMEFNNILFENITLIDSNEHMWDI